MFQGYEIVVIIAFFFTLSIKMQNRHI